MTVLVIYTDKVEETLEFFQGMGLVFVEEKHGDGPTHYASQNGDNVFEIYPTAIGDSRVRFINQ
jgi:catechol 2,3-dioxygenase-like lactoylglutathione lyase family enzyme